MVLGSPKNEGDIYFVGISPILAGILIVVVMKFMPGGLIGLTEKLTSHRGREWLKARAEGGDGTERNNS